MKLRFESLSQGSIEMMRNGKLSRRRSAAFRRRFIPGIDLMEDRTLLSTLTVMNNHRVAPARCATIAAAASGDTINFSSKLRGETITLTSGELTVGVNLTVDGPGANQLAISGDGAGRVFEIAAGLNVTISGLTITHGYARDQGGGILNDGSNLTLSGDVFAQNVAMESATVSADGGALDSLAGTLTINGCTITGNQALGAAGAAAFGDAFGGGAFTASGGSATIFGTLVTANDALGGLGGSGGSDGNGGGGLYVATGASVSLQKTKVRGNFASTSDNNIYGIVTTM